MIQTVTGPIPAAQLGRTLPHEHLYIDLRPLVSPPPDAAKRALFYQPLSLATVGYTLSNPYALLDNAVIADAAVLREELRLYRAAGGSTIVDVTPRSIGRDPLALAELARATGVQIVAGCGEYIGGAPAGASAEQLAEELVRELTVGIDGTSIRAGVIGEIGTSAEISEPEWRSLRAAGLAQRATGPGIHVHTALWAANGLKVIDALTALGVPPNRIAIDHIDVDLRYDYTLALCRAGALVEFDNFGKEYYISGRERYFMEGRFAYDLERVRLLVRLVEAGYLAQILITNDICLKSLLHSYGGRGYDHILTNIVPMLEDEGLTSAQIDQLTITNPACFLDAPERR